VEAEGTVDKTDNARCFSEIVTRPSLMIPSEEHHEPTGELAREEYVIGILTIQPCSADDIARREPVLFCGLLDRFPVDQKQGKEAEQITHDSPPTEA
jgi:hypothetical protein